LHASQLNSRASASPAENEIPLCVDLDGTLLKGDSLLVAFSKWLRCLPGSLWPLLRAVPAGWAGMKTQLYCRLCSDGSHLPFNEPLLEWLKEQKGQGRTIYLVSGSPEPFVKSVAEQLGIFSGAMGTTPGINLVGSRKRDLLVSRFGEGRFDYVGDSNADIPVWQAAHEAYIAGPNASRVQAGRRLTGFGEQDADPEPRLRVWLRAARCHQWLKNVLVAMPVVAGHRWAQADVLAATLVAFVAWSFTASAGYLPEHQMLLSQAGTACAVSATLVIALYVHSEDILKLYSSLRLLLLACPLVLYGLLRLWYLGWAGKMQYDPLLVCIRDRPTLLVGVGLLMTILLSSLC
jgi:hypothetical protein